MECSARNHADSGSEILPPKSIGPQYPVVQEDKQMGSTHSILVSVDDETHRRARIRADQLQLSVPELAATVLSSAVEMVDISEEDLEEALGDEEADLDELIGRIRATHPDFRASDNLTRTQLYERAGRGRS